MTPTLRNLTAACAAALLTLGVGHAQPTTAPAQSSTPSPASAAPSGSSAAPAGSPATPSTATDSGSTYTPHSGQAGKDVVWVPTPQELVDQMLDSAGVTSADYVIDLGSGDGRTVITAARRGARALGIEYNPDMVELARRNAEREGVGKEARFEQADIFKTDFSDATVLTLFLLPQLNLKLRPTILDMKPGTRVVSNAFDMGEWVPDQRIEGGDACRSWCRAYKWIVPAKVAGDWQVGNGKLHLVQTFQELEGTLTRDGKTLPISEAKMNGREISFVAGGQRYTGQANDATMAGQVGGKPWSATRVGG